eukprot:275899-Prymnesium_polylepis.1
MVQRGARALRAADGTGRRVRARLHRAHVVAAVEERPVRADGAAQPNARVGERWVARLGRRAEGGTH